MELVRNPRLWEKFLAKSGLILQSCVGNGSFGDVFSVTMATTGDAKAVKRLVARRKISEDVYAMAEIEALMELRHPNIVALEEVMLCSRMVCLVMELAPWGNLELLVTERFGQKQNQTSFQQQPQENCPVLNDQFKYNCFQQLTSAVDFCHCQDLAHRDVNPSNVLIFHQTLVKLADFNLCFRCSDVTSDDPLLCNDYLGQDAYLAPEVKSHKPFNAKPADVWSLGSLLYFIITGEHPSKQESLFMDSLSKLEAEIRGNEEEINNNPTSWSLRKLASSLINKMCSEDFQSRPTVENVLNSWELCCPFLPDMDVTIHQCDSTEVIK